MHEAPPTPAAPPAPPAEPLAHGLKQRHLTMLGLGGVIGAGLFVGSGAGIAVAGPAIVVSYLIAGALAMLVMRMLGEMSSAMPASGSFSVHAERALGRWAGFSVGLACTGSCWWSPCSPWRRRRPRRSPMAGCRVSNRVGVGRRCSWWSSPRPNLTAVKNFGEFEFWFAALEGRRDRRVPGARRAGGPRRAAGHGRGGDDQPDRPTGGFLPERLERGRHPVVLDRRLRVRRSGGRHHRGGRVGDPARRRRGRSAARWCASLFFYIGSMAGDRDRWCRGTPEGRRGRPVVKACSTRPGRRQRRADHEPW
ncbi:amino acid permease [Streptomyces fimicarius] [Streptomyces griseus]